MTRLSERAKHRLRIAAGLLRGTGRSARHLDLPRNRFYDAMQELLAGMTDDERSHLKELTDWVEAYDNAPDPSPTRRARNAAQPP